MYRRYEPGLPQDRYTGQRLGRVGESGESGGEAVRIPLAEVLAAPVDALYRETEELVSQWQAAGAEIIKMESGAFYPAYAPSRTRSLGLGFLRDCLIETGWQDWHVNLRELAEITAAVCLEIVRDCLRV